MAGRWPDAAAGGQQEEGTAPGEYDLPAGERLLLKHSSGCWQQQRNED
jgi:hypothetical protein